VQCSVYTRCRTGGQQQRRAIRRLHDAISRDDVTTVKHLTTPTTTSGSGLDYNIDQSLRGLTALQACGHGLVNIIVTI